MANKIHMRHEWGMTLCGRDGWRTMWSTWDEKTSLPSTDNHHKVTCKKCNAKIVEGK